tara:strand:+ start:251 stop:370 length:120 start_codon:yes stop_codon:yes gene_type:complete
LVIHLLYLLHKEIQVEQLKLVQQILMMQVVVEVELQEQL